MIDTSEAKLKKLIADFTIEVTALAAQLKEPAAEAKKPWPQNSDEYYLANETEGVGNTYWDNSVYDLGRQSQGNVFPTRVLAQHEVLRRESMAKRVKIKPGQPYYYWEFANGYVMRDDNYTGHDVDLNRFFIGSAHPTGTECAEWGRKYAASWMVLLEENK